MHIPFLENQLPAVEAFVNWSSNKKPTVGSAMWEVMGGGAEERDWRKH